MKLKIPKIVGFLILMAFIITISYLIPFSLVLGKQGFQEPDVAYTIDFYTKILYGGLIGVMVLYLISYFWKSDDKYGESIGFFNIGERPSLKMFKRFTAPQLTLLSLIFFSIVFLLAHLMNFSSFTGLKVLPQQFSPLDSISLSTLIIPAAENLLLATLIGLIILVLNIIAIKRNMLPKDYSIYAISVVTILSGIFGVIWHSTAYQSSVTSLYVVFAFWAFMGFLAIITGLWTIPFLVHLLNNFFIDFSRIFSNDTLLLTVVGVIVVVIGGLYFIIYKNRLFGGRNENTP